LDLPVRGCAVRILAI